MRELRLIGVDDAGERLLLTEDGEDRFGVPIDDALRSAIRTARRAPSADVDSVQVPEDLRPRDVQALLRAGVSVADVAERAGWSTEKVQRYERPIRAERDHIADEAQRLAVLPTADGAAATFGTRVHSRLDGRGVEADDVVWDAWRDADGGWTVLCVFPAGGKQRQAGWRFDPARRSIEPVDDEARWLSEDEGSPGPLPGPAAQTATVYDVEAEGGLDAPAGSAVRRVRGGRTSPTAIPAAPRPETQPAKDDDDAGPVDLVAAMRQRSKNRRRKGHPAGSDKSAGSSPTVKLDTSGDPPPVGSHPRGADGADTDAASVDQLGHDPVTGTADLFADLPAADDAGGTPTERAADDPADGTPSEADQAASTTGSRPPQARPDDGADPAERASGDAGRAERDPEPEADPESDADSDRDADGTDDHDTGEQDHKDGQAGPEKPDSEPSEPSEPAVPDRPSTARKGRPSVPSWDDIMFGRRPGRD